MRFALATTKPSMSDAKSRLNDLARIIGPNAGWTIIFSRTDLSRIERWSWKCGCQLDSIGDRKNGAEKVIQWTTCADHPQVKLPP